MGKDTFSRDVFTRAAHAATDGGRESATKKSEQQAKKTGKLNPLVDPSGYDVIRLSLPRLEQNADGLWELLVGTPLPVETRVDTTGSMGNNVDIALSVLPNMYEACLAAVREGYDIQIATGIFGDVVDPFPLCRPQFEMVADKIVGQLALMVPERDGGDGDEDPHYGIFGGAYLTAAHISKLGLKGYDFTVSDAPCHERFDSKQLIRIFGPDVFEKVAENGHTIDRKQLPSPRDVVKDLLKRAHAFFLQVKDESSRLTRFWSEIYSPDRVVWIPDTHVLPQVQAAIIGLTEGTLDLGNTKEFLRDQQVPAKHIDAIMRSVSGIPLGAQAALPNFKKLPKKGDLFEKKDSLWPIDPMDVKAPGGKPAGGKGKKKTDWL